MGCREAAVASQHVMARFFRTKWGFITNRHGICHAYTRIISVQNILSSGVILAHKIQCFSKSKVFTFLRSFGGTFICPEAYHGHNGSP